MILPYNSWTGISVEDIRNKYFKGQLVKMFELVEGRIGSSYGAISSRSKTNSAGTVFKSVRRK
jgi:hypothetical protein